MIASHCKNLALRTAVFVSVLVPLGCDAFDADSLSLSSNQRTNRPLALGERSPDAAENEVVGAVSVRVARKSLEWQQLVHCQSRHVIFKDEERTGADRRTTAVLCARLARLGELVSSKWPELRLRVTEAWDENGEHGRGSLHYEGRAADITTSDMDASKLGRLGQLALEAGFDWVYYEDRSHVHVSVRRSK